MLEPWCERTAKGGIKLNQIVKNPLPNENKAIIELEDVIFLLREDRMGITGVELLSVIKHVRKIKKKLRYGE